LTSTPVDESPTDAEADTVTVGMATEAEAEAVVCKLAFETDTVRDGGGVRDTPTAVTERDWDADA